MNLKLHTVALALACVIGLAACGGTDDGGTTDSDPTSTEAANESGGDDSPVAERIEEIQVAVNAWASAESVAQAHAAAETAINLVSGPNAPLSGDRDGDGTVQGESASGLLSGSDGTPAGLATEIDPSVCVVRDVLGSTADGAAAGWAETKAAIDAWGPDNNTMPTLLSHPMRVVGWASFTLASDDLDDAHEYAGHAQLHVDIARDALDCDE